MKERKGHRELRPLGLLGLLRSLRPLRPLGLLGILGLMGLGLVGCSSEDAEEQAVAIPIELTTYVAGYQDGSAETEESRRVGVTRAWLPPSGFELVPENGKTIGINFTNDFGATAEDRVQSGYFFNSGGWRTTLDIKSGAYYLYGYTPHNSSVSCTIVPDAVTGKYEDGAVMTLNNLPAVTSGDVCVVVGAKNGADDYKANADYSVAGLRQGDFFYKAVGSESNYVYLLFDHLYAALHIEMRVHGDYAALRTIKLKELRLRAYVGETATPHKKRTNATVTLKKTSGTSPINDIVFDMTGDEDEDGTSFFKSKTGQPLTTTYQPFQGHFMPQDVSKLVLTSVYDVYDNDSEGKARNLVRKDCEAENTLVISDIFDRQEVFKRGWKYTINMTIQPTYLYVLSDPDLNSPTAILN